MGLWSRLFGSPSAKAAEGEFRLGPYPVDGGWLPAGSPWNVWQLGRSAVPLNEHSAMVEACVSAYAQTSAMCPGDHWRRLGNGGRERVTNSALSRVLRRPNGYQSPSDFILNAVRSLYVDGNAYAVAVRNDRFEIAELHLMAPRQCGARVAETGEVFYHLAGNELVERRFGGSLIAPARDVLHVRLHTPRHPLKGESPIMAAALDVAAQNTILQQQIAFFSNRSRPSFVLTTDEKLTPEQAAALRQRWEEQSQGLNEGRTPVLGWGIKPQAIGNTAQDAQLAETMKMSEEHIALAFRVPLQILGKGGTPFASTESLMQSWIASGLGFCLNHVEQAFDGLFGLKGYPDEYVEFDTTALLRSAFKDRIEGLARGVQSGIYSPDEARAREDLPSVPGGYGKEPRVQQQVVPLSWHEQQAAVPPAPSPPQLPAPPAAESPDDADDAAGRAALEQFRRQVRDAARRVH